MNEKVFIFALRFEINPDVPCPMDEFSIGREFPVHFLKERESNCKSVLFIG